MLPGPKPKAPSAAAIGRRRPCAALGVPTGPKPAAAGRPAGGLVPDIDRSVHPLDARSEGTLPVSPGRQADPDPPRHVRPDRPAADPGGGRGVRGRSVARRLRQGRRPAAGLAPLRRALGAALARRGPLRRHQGLRPLRGRELPLGVHLSRLRDPGLQRRRALRSVHRRATGRRPPAAGAGPGRR